tara:strand:+ start:1034 stop:1192 length:159 start_codon:yes stop_codon:yes gene_type:complete
MFKNSIINMYPGLQPDDGHDQIDFKEFILIIITLSLIYLFLKWIGVDIDSYI